MVLMYKITKGLWELTYLYSLLDLGIHFLPLEVIYIRF